MTGASGMQKEGSHMRADCCWALQAVQQSKVRTGGAMRHVSVS